MANHARRSATAPPPIPWLPRTAESRSALPARMALAVILVMLVCSAGCQSTRQLPAVNFAEPGWTVRQGQAVWIPRRGAPELAGELIVATRDENQVFVQFTKTPFPIVTAQQHFESWKIDFAGGEKRFFGRGTPPGRLLWFQLAPALRTRAVSPPWAFETRDSSGWRFSNARTGESLEGYVAP